MTENFKNGKYDFEFRRLLKSGLKKVHPRHRLSPGRLPPSLRSCVEEQGSQ